MGWTPLENSNGEKIGTVGDEVWDIMGNAIEKIIDTYMTKIKRPPTLIELQSIFDFVVDEEELSERSIESDE